MDHDNKAAFVNQMHAMAAVFNHNLDDATVTGYWMALRELEFDKVATAMMTAIKTSDYFPRPAVLIRLIEPDPNARIVAAWDAVQSVFGAESFVAAPSVQFTDPLINAAVRSLGGSFRIIKMTKSEFETWFRKDFERVYETLLRTPPTEHQSRPVIGQSKRIQTIECNYIQSLPKIASESSDRAFITELADKVSLNSSDDVGQSEEAA